MTERTFGAAELFEHASAGNRPVDRERVEPPFKWIGDLQCYTVSDAKTGEPINRVRHAMRAGPAADERIHARMETYLQRRAQQRDTPSKSSQ